MSSHNAPMPFYSPKVPGGIVYSHMSRGAAAGSSGAAASIGDSVPSPDPMSGVRFDEKPPDDWPPNWPDWEWPPSLFPVPDLPEGPEPFIPDDGFEQPPLVLPWPDQPEEPLPPVTGPTPPRPVPLAEYPEMPIMDWVDWQRRLRRLRNTDPETPLGRRVANKRVWLNHPGVGRLMRKIAGGADALGKPSPYNVRALFERWARCDAEFPDLLSHLLEIANHGLNWRLSQRGTSSGQRNHALSVHRQLLSFYNQLVQLARQAGLPGASRLRPG